MHYIKCFTFLNCKNKIIPSGSWFWYIDRREYSFFLQLPVQDKFHVACALEFFKDNIIHFASCIYQRSCQNGKTSAFSYISRSSEESLRHVECGRIQTARKGSSWRLDRKIIRPCKSCDRVKKNSYVFSMFYESLGSLDDHFRYTLMMFRLLIKCRIYDLYIISKNRFFYICYFLRSFIYQKDHKMHFFIVYSYGVGNIFKKRCFTGLRRRNDHTPLTLADRGYKIYYPAG